MIIVAIQPHYPVNMRQGNARACPISCVSFPYLYCLHYQYTEHPYTSHRHYRAVGEMERDLKKRRLLRAFTTIVCQEVLGLLSASALFDVIISTQSDRLSKESKSLNVYVSVCIITAIRLM